MQLTVWNRPANKDAGVNQPAYSDQQKATREIFAKAIHKTLLEKGEALGMYLTPNKDGDGLLVALTLPIPELEFTNPNGQKMRTRAFSINVNAPIAVEKTAKPAAISLEPIDFDAMMKQIDANRLAKKADRR